MNPEGQILFWKPASANGWLSNWSKHPIQENGVYFKTVEHYIMYRKALLMKDSASATKILDTDMPYRVRQLGRKIVPYDEKTWASNREAIIFDAILLKVEAYPSLKVALVTSGNKTIVEASPYDKIWGVGLAASDPRILLPEYWEGTNLLGEAWMKVRAHLREGIREDGEDEEEEE